MSNIKTFHLPDLGEGLPDATIVEWLVKEGDQIKLDAPLVSMETAKAVVEVPSPYTGKLTKLHGKAGDVIDTGAALAEFELDPNAKQRAENAAGGHHHAPSPATAAKPAPAPAATKTADREDEGTVVGAMVSSNEVIVEQAASVGGVKAVPAVRAMAKKLKVDLARVQPTGAGGAVTMQDVKNAAAAGTATASAAPVRAQPAPAPAITRTPLSASGQPMRTAPPSAQQVFGQPEQLKGVRRNTARATSGASWCSSVWPAS
jgi:pyruvate dehydrogenase E2 component (dihydrolipoamide acetyltransferase)